MKKVHASLMCIALSGCVAVVSPTVQNNETKPAPTALQSIAPNSPAGGEGEPTPNATTDILYRYSPTPSPAQSSTLSASPTPTSVQTASPTPSPTQTPSPTPSPTPRVSFENLTQDGVFQKLTEYPVGVQIETRDNGYQYSALPIAIGVKRDTQEVYVQLRQFDRKKQEQFQTNPQIVFEKVYDYQADSFTAPFKIANDDTLACVMPTGETTIPFIWRSWFDGFDGVYFVDRESTGFGTVITSRQSTYRMFVNQRSNSRESCGYDGPCIKGDRLYNLYELYPKLLVEKPYTDIPSGAEKDNDILVPNVAGVPKVEIDVSVLIGGRTQREGNSFDVKLKGNVDAIERLTYITSTHLFYSRSAQEVVIIELDSKLQYVLRLPEDKIQFYTRHGYDYPKFHDEPTQIAYHESRKHLYLAYGQPQGDGQVSRASLYRYKIDPTSVFALLKFMKTFYALNGTAHVL